MNSPRTVRIFISSPGDVAEERERARQVIEGLRRRYAGRLLLQPILWEDLPLQADTAFQEGIDSVLTDNREVSIAVFILWSRLGSALGPRIRKADGSEYRSGTEREFDLMMQARRQSRGARPAILAYIRQDLASFEERLRGKPQDERNELLAQMNLLKSFVQESFQDQESGHNIGAYHSFDRPVSFSQRLRTHLVALLDELAGDTDQASWDVTALGPPFLGLQSFQPEHADIFFGREEETQEARFALGEQAKRGCAFLLITGASGSGKSSLARAGVLPEILNNEKDEQVTEWRSMILTPAELSPRPVHEFVNRLAQPDLLPELAPTRAEVASQLCDDPTQTVTHLLRPIFHRLPGNTGGQVRLLLVLDQLEEIFAAHVMTAEDRQSFLKLLEALARSGFVWVLATARSDFYHQIQEEPVLARLLEGRGPMPLLPPKPDALQRLIEEPARLAGLRFEQDEQGVSLARRILRDASNHAEMLPLVEFVLRELFDQRAPDGTMSRAVYEKLGGVEGAVGQKAEETFQSLPLESQAAFTEILPRLVSLETDGGESAVRRWAPLAELQASPARKQLTNALIAGRFFTADQQGNAPVAGFSHEALLRCWPRITQWIAANREFLRMRSRVEQQQQRWEQQGSDTSLLLPPGLPLEEGRTLLTGARHVLSEQSAAFIQTSLDHAAAQEAKARRRRRAVLAVMGALTCVAMVGGLFAWVKQQESVEAEKHAVAEQERSREAEQIAQAEQKKSQAAEQEAVAERKKAVEANKTAEQKSQEALTALTQSRRRLALNYFQHGVSEYDAGRPDSACRDLFLATKITDSEDPLLPSLQGVLTDRLARGGRSPGLVMRHAGNITCVAYSPDGSRIATGSEDQTTRIWDARTGAPLCEPIKSNSEVLLLAFSPDGSRLIIGSNSDVQICNGHTGQSIGEPVRLGERTLKAISPDATRFLTSSYDRTIFQLWDVNTGTPLGEPMRHENTQFNYDNDNPELFSPDGKRIVTRDGKNARIWDAESGQPLTEPMVHQGNVFTTKFSTDGTQLLTTTTIFAINPGSFAVVYLWNTKTGQLILNMRTDVRSVPFVTFSPDGTYLVTAEPNSRIMKFWNCKTGKPFRESVSLDRELTNLVFSPDGTRLTTTHSDNSIRIWKTSGMTPIGDPIPHDDPVRGPQFSPDGTQLVTVAGKTARIWTAFEGLPRSHSMRDKNGVSTLAMSPDGNRIATLSIHYTNDNVNCNGSVRIWDVGSSTQSVGPIHLEGDNNHLSFSPEGNRILAFKYNQVKILDAFHGRLISKIQPIPYINDIPGLAEWNNPKFSPDGNIVFVPVQGDWDARTGAPLSLSTWRADSELNIQRLQFSSEGAHLALTTAVDQTVRIWDTKTGNPVYEPYEPYHSTISAAINHDGSRIATGSTDGVVRIWDIQSHKPVGEPIRLQPNDSGVRLVFSPDGSRLVTVTNAVMRSWDSQTGAAIGEPMRHDGRVSCVAFSADGNRMISGSEDLTARIWDAKSGEPVGKTIRHESNVTHVGWNADGTRIVTGTIYDQTIRIWNAITGEPISDPMKNQSFELLAISPDGARIVITVRGNMMQIWDTQTGATLGQPMNAPVDVTEVAFSPDGSQVISRGWDLTPRHWNANTGEPVDNNPQQFCNLQRTAFSRDASFFVTGVGAKTARIWDAKTHKPIGQPLDHPSRLTDIQINASGTVIATTTEDHSVFLWNATTGIAIGEPMRHQEPVGRVLFYPDGTHILTLSGENSWQAWNASTGRSATGPMQLEKNVEGLTFSPDGTRLVNHGQFPDQETVELFGSTSIIYKFKSRIWDAHTLEPVGEPMTHEAHVLTLTFSPDGSRIVTSYDDRTIRIWDAGTGQPGSELMPDRFYPHVEFSPDGKFVITRPEANGVRLCDIGKGTLGKRIDGSGGEGLYFSPDGTRIATKPDNKTVRIWDTNTGEPVGEPLRLEAGIRNVVFSHDSSRVATVSDGYTAQIWDGNTGAKLGTTIGQAGEVSCLAFTPDGTRIVIGAGESVVIRKLEDLPSTSDAGAFQEYQTGVTFDANSLTSRTLTNEELNERVQLLTSNVGWLNELSVYSASRKKEIQYGLLESAAKAGNGFGMAFHLKRLPADEDVEKNPQKLRNFSEKTKKALLDLSYILNQPADEVESLLNFRLHFLVWKKDQKALREMAEAYSNLVDNHQLFFDESRYLYSSYGAAQAWSLLSDLAKEEAAACEDYATKALAYLKKVCFAEGKPGAWATPAEMAAHMKQDKDMDPLRDRPDFQALMAELETKKGP